MNIKEEIKEEPCFLDFGSENDSELFVKDPTNKVKIETVTSSSDCDIDIKTVLEEEAEVSNLCSLDQRELSSEGALMGYNNDEMGTKIEIKEQYCLQGGSTETPSSYDDIKDRRENFHFIELPRLTKVEVSSYMPELFSNDDLGNDTTFYMKKDSPECTSDGKCVGENSVCSETPDGKILSMPSLLNQNYLLQQNNTNKQKISMENSELSDLEKHKLIHKGIKSHKCNICNKALTQLKNLKAHKLIHEGVKPHKCDVCNKAFTQVQHLQTHKLIHEGIKPYNCDICHKAFTQLITLKRHKLIHEGIKPHKCDICSKNFTQLSSLKKHKMIHEGIKPHECNICNKAFTQLSSLKTHTLIHEGIKPHKCIVCHRAFTDLSTLKRHKLIHEYKEPQ